MPGFSLDIQWLACYKRSVLLRETTAIPHTTFVSRLNVLGIVNDEAVRPRGGAKGKAKPEIPVEN